MQPTHLFVFLHLWGFFPHVFHFIEMKNSKIIIFEISLLLLIIIVVVMHNNIMPVESPETDTCVSKTLLNPCHEEFSLCLISDQVRYFLFQLSKLVLFISF